MGSGRAGGRSRGELVGEAPSTSSQLFSSRWGKPHPERSTLLAKDKMAHCLHSSGGKSGPSGHLGFVSTQVKQPHGPSFSVACKSLNIGREKKKKRSQDVNNRNEKNGVTPTSSKRPEEKCNSTTTGQSTSNSLHVHKPDPAAWPQLWAPGADPGDRIVKEVRRLGPAQCDGTLATLLSQTPPKE